MPQQTYEIQAPDGRIVEIQADRMPSGDELSSLIQQLPPAPTASAQTPAQSGGSWTNTAANALPAVGGMIGGLLPSPLRPLTSAIGGAAGEGYKQLVQHGAEIPGAVADVARNLVAQPVATMTGATEGMRSGAQQAATQGALQGTAEALGGAVTKGATMGARAVYRGMLKPSLAANKVRRAEDIVTTALKEGLPLSHGGVAKGERIIKELKGEVDQLLHGSNRTVDLKAIANRIRSFARRKYYRPGVDVGDFEMAMSVADRIDAHPSLNIPPGAVPSAIRVPLGRANVIKQGLDTSIGDAAFGVTSPVKKTTEKAARHAMNEAMQSQMPAIRPLNARESRLIDATKSIAQAVQRQSNQDKLVGWKTLAAATYGAGTSDDPYEAAAKTLATRMLLAPAVASQLALIAARTGRQLGVGAESAARLAFAAMTASDGKDTP